MRHRHWIGLASSIILGLIFITAGLGKLLDQDEIFGVLFSYYPAFLTSAQAKLAFTWIPWIELIVGVLLITGIAAKFVASLSTLLIAAFITNNIWLINHGLGYKPCGCLGIAERIIQYKLSTLQSLYLDIGMLALVLVILLCHQSSFLNIYPWFLRRGKN